MSDSTDLSLITIDLDDTVWPCAPVIQQAEVVMFEWLKTCAPRLTAVHDINSMRTHRRDFMSEHSDIAHDLTAVRIATLRRLLEEHDYPLELAEEAIQVFLEARNQVTPYPDVAPVLKTLSMEYCLASVTNGNADVQRTPLRPHFHISVTAADVGAAKPAPDMFYRVLEQAGVEPANAVHVGDDPRRDIAAAQRVGMRSLWINRNGSSWPEELPPPEATVTNFYELQSWLA